MPHDITSFSNPLIKRVRSLRDKKHRKAEGLFIAEGLRIVTEASDAGHRPRYLIFSSDSEAHPLMQRLIAETEAAGGTAVRTSRDILQKISGKDNPQAVIGVFDDLKIQLSALDRGAADIWIVAQALRDPGNLGTLLRTGDAVGAGGLILVDDCCDPFSVEAVRASMGAIFTQRVAVANWEDFLPWLRSGPGQLVGTSLNATEDYRQPRYQAPVFVLMGNEKAGLPEAYEKACDLLVRLPMRGRADSLNVSVAAGVMLYEVLNQLGEKPARV